MYKNILKDNQNVENYTKILKAKVLIGLEHQLPAEVRTKMFQLSN